MIVRAWFKDFKLLRDVSLDLGPLNVIVGRKELIPLFSGPMVPAAGTS